MSVSSKIKSIMVIKGIKNDELAVKIGIKPQSLRNKFTRNSFSVDDLIKISEILGVKIVLDIGEGQNVLLNNSDI